MPQLADATRPFAQAATSNDASAILESGCIGAAFWTCEHCACLMMALYWHDLLLASFAFTLIVEPGHTTFLALPPFLIFESISRVTFLSCVITGVIIGAAPIDILTFWIDHSAFYAMIRTDGGSTADSALATATALADCIQPSIYCGLSGALGGLVFWAALAWSGRLTRAHTLQP
jgi:hypothetical protein